MPRNDQYRFTADNTEGYGPEDLALLNSALDTYLAEFDEEFVKDFGQIARNATDRIHNNWRAHGNTVGSLLRGLSLPASSPVYKQEFDVVLDHPALYRDATLAFGAGASPYVEFMSADGADKSEYEVHFEGDGSEEHAQRLREAALADPQGFVEDSLALLAAHLAGELASHP